MSAFVRVEARNADPTALGILVPPGATTLVILRPRGLEWDLLPARWAGNSRAAPAFCQFGRDEAALLARRVPECLEQAVQMGESPLQTFGNADRYQIWARCSDYVWIVCKRFAGERYEPALFSSRAEAEAIGASLEPYFYPAPDANQPYYF